MQDRLNTKELDQKLAKLKEIGLKEISKSTKLASSKIEDVLEKRFDKLDRVRARGFINILEREYEIDLSDWLKAQQEFIQRESITQVSQVIAKQDEQIQQVGDSPKPQDIFKTHEEKVLDIALKAKPIAHSQKESHAWFYVILGLVLFVFVGYLAYKAFMSDDPRNQEMSVNDSRIQREVSEQTQDVIDTQMSNAYDGMFFDPTQSSENDEQKSFSQDQQEPKASSVQAQDLLQSTQTSTSIGETRPSTSEQRSMTMDTMDSASVSNALKDDILRVQSSGELWLGVIDLDSGTKEQFLYKDQYDVKLKGRMLLVMGHANFTLMLNGQSVSHGAKPPVRMYYDGSTLVDVGLTRFRQLNGGAEW